MGNFKVRVNNEAESKEIQNILESIGFRKFEAWSELGSIGGFIWTDSDMTYCDNKIEYFDESPRKEITLPELRAMVSPMKEYLDKQEDGTYKLITASGGCVDRDWIEVPEGAIRARFYPHDPDELEFENAFYQWWHGENKEWSYYADYAGSVEYSRVVWRRTPSLNDQYAEIEQVHQHRHYFIDVSDVDEIDFYEIALRYNVTDPCIQHILKKCLAVGQRGQKDFHHDLKDIYDTAKRMLDVHGLDS